MNKTECGKKHSREWDQRGSKVGMGNKKYREQARVSVGVGFGMGMEGSFWSLAPSRQGESEEIRKAVMGFRGNLRAADLW